MFIFQLSSSKRAEIETVFLVPAKLNGYTHGAALADEGYRNPFGAMMPAGLGSLDKNDPVKSTELKFRSKRFSGIDIEGTGKKSIGPDYEEDISITVSKRPSPFPALVLNVKSTGQKYDFANQIARNQIRPQGAKEQWEEKFQSKPGIYKLASHIAAIEGKGGKEKEVKYAVSFQITKSLGIEILDSSGKVAKKLDFEGSQNDRDLGTVLLSAAYASEKQKNENPIFPSFRDMLGGCFARIVDY